MTVDLQAVGEAHALTIGGYGVHCKCGYYFVGFGPNPRTQESCVKAYGWADETLFEHIARVIADPAPRLDVAVLSETWDNLTAIEIEDDHGYVRRSRDYNELSPESIAAEYSRLVLLKRTPDTSPPVAGPTSSWKFEWKFDSQCQVTPATHVEGAACESLIPHSHRDNAIKWARPFQPEKSA